MSDGLKFGADPEIFVVNENGEISCPISILPIAKEVNIIARGGGVNRDGIAFELNPAPSEIPAEVALNMSDILLAGAQKLSLAGLKVIKSLGVTIRENMPPDAYQFGCDPDYNAYTKGMNRCKLNPKKYLKRFAGGHISMQLPVEPSFDQVCDIVKLMDFFVGLPSLFLIPDSEREAAVERRKSYGAAGCFRWKVEDRIIEYRTPDASWLWHDGAYERLCIGMRRAFEEFVVGLRVIDSKPLRQAINTCDLKLATILLDTQGVLSDTH